jgi:uncharacterized GH25 family protein
MPLISTSLHSMLALLTFLLLTTPAQAHEFILKPETATPAVGQKTPVQAQASHVFMVSEEAENPADVQLQLLQEGRSTDISLSENKGALTLAGNFTLTKNGAALLVGHRLPQIWCETTEGVTEGTRAALEAKGMKVKSVGKYEKFAKTLLNPTSGDTQYARPIGQALEIMLLNNPADIKTGNQLTVQVLLRGKPAANAPVGLTYDGFSKAEDAYKVTANTDAQGKAVLTVDKPGLWMARTAVTEKTPGTDADAHHMRATFVFPIR